jgi:phosphohistidine phosphatase
VSANLRRLLVMRHAKTEAVAASDHARRLTERGRRDATAAGRWARSVHLLPEYAVVSDATRTRETWSLFALSAGLELEAHLEPSLYAAGPEGSLAVLRTIPAEVSTGMVVGHNPTVAQLVHLLDDGTADPDAFRQLGAGFVPGSVAVLELTDGWSGLGVATARIVRFHPAHS